MTRIPILNVWSNVVKHYYAEIQPTSKHTIWSWVEADYNGYHRGRPGLPGGADVYDFVLQDDVDATAFKLKFMQPATA